MNTLKKTQDKTAAPLTEKSGFLKTINILISVLFVNTFPAIAQMTPFILEKPAKILKAPDFSLKTPDGRRLTLKQYKGKVVLLVFWATWCLPCTREMPSVNRLFKRFKEEGLRVIAVSADRGGADNVTRFMKRNSILFPIALDRDGKVRNEYEVTALPFTYLIDREGRFLGRLIGERDWDAPDVRGFFTKLLNGSSAHLPKI